MSAFSLGNAGVGTRLGSAFGVLALLLLVSVAFGVTRLASLNASVASLQEKAHAGALAATLVAQAHETSSALGRAVMADSVDVIQSSLKEADTLRADSGSTRQALAGLTTSDDARALLKAVEAAEPVYRSHLDKVTAAVKNGDTDAARIALNDKALRGAEASLLKALGALDAFERKAMAAATAQAAAAYAVGRNLLIAAAAVAVALAAGLGLWMTRSLVRQLGGEPGTAADLARSVAQGDLSVHIDVRPGDSTSLMAQLKAMQESLARVVSGVRQNSETVASASQQIAQGNHDLSLRTEQQACALQQTAASMAQLDSTVKRNADNARQANELARGASTVALKGGEVVGQVVETMKGINDSSKKIADIISVIDGIAFQTNILALNAAVEAARAGEQGRGFAVVASEVRNLAQRSSAAAKEIKTLIGASVDRVEQGTALVDQAGVTMEEIVVSIRRVTAIMGEISAASTDQSTGVAQVGEAVSQMDRATQQNAALVEQSAAAAESLKAQAQQLVQAVAVFKLDPHVPEERHGAAPSERAAKSV
ncbi:methyl-accepting chemotaxis protein [Aquabacterium sp.]|uniref:methyl-accepting chemotaxis protein n=1 Tax=Aquabacterium sp. TaxID=1872578 RepID=UPI002CD21C2F|nr:methyl-accepting chemotaxis protein [Aquabacterium sp.]HSW03316.1 methyl-accepting chemotaxis protein [Aquabacterium sp.]